MYQSYKTDKPNEVHQLLVSVSKHYLVGYKGIIRFQKKKMDVSLRNFHKSDREHLVYYILRDHFSSFYYIEVTSTRKLIPLQDFLLRAFLPKPDIYFGGIPKALMVPKDVEALFLPLDDFLNGLKIQKIHPVSGFASGITAVKDWESLMRIPLIPSEGLDNIRLWNPRTPMHYLEVHNSKNRERWQYSLPENVFIPDEDYVRRTASPEFKHATEYALYLPIWEQHGT